MRAPALLRRCRLGQHGGILTAISPGHSAFTLRPVAASGGGPADRSSKAHNSAPGIVRSAAAGT